MSTELADPVFEQGMALFRSMAAESAPAFTRRFWIEKLMTAVIEHPSFKLPLFRFIDVLPSLTSDDAIGTHLREYFLADGHRVPGSGLSLLAGGLTGPMGQLAGRLIRSNTQSLARTFIVGPSPVAALPTLRKLWASGSLTSIDLLGEAALSEVEADRYRDGYLDLIGVLAEELAGAPARGPQPGWKAAGLNLSVKLSALYSRIGPVNHDDSLVQVQARLRPIFRKAMAVDATVYIDMETVSLKDLTIDIVTGLLDEPEFAGWDRAGIALQAYLHSAENDVRRVIDWARRNRRRIAVRLVKGAYWEFERTLAMQRNWPVPVFAVKSHTDASYERCLGQLLAAHEHISLAVASHNPRAIAAALVLAERLRVPRERYEFQALYGMAEPIKSALKRMGYPVREYAPIGELIPGMAYLVRRLLENTSNEGFLSKIFAGQAPPEQMLATPESCPEVAVVPGPCVERPFSNEPPLDFSRSGNRDGFASAITAARQRLGQHHPVVYGGREYNTSDRLVSVNPSRPDEIVCTASRVDRATAEVALRSAREAQPAWGGRSPAERAAVLFRAARIARRRRLELAAWELLEVGKNRVEADADVCEAIDFLEYYGREMVRLGQAQALGEAPGECNRYVYQPRGVGLVLAPWNFPLAISIGMAAAALVTGNTVLYKPSSQSVQAGWLVYEIFREAGVPDGVLQFVPGSGAAVGDYLVEHPLTDFILFTGSLAVGLGILEKAGRTRPGQKAPKKAVIETGGKNAIIVDLDADLDQAVPGVIQSAFGFQGQKCSACSRVIVLGAIYDRFIGRLAEATRELPVGDPADPKQVVGPVIDAEARDTIQAWIELGRREGRILAQARVPDSGYYVPPTVIVDLPATSTLLADEIFGPVLAVIRVETLEEAIAVANSSVYALTGGLYSRSPANIRKAVADFAAGNLYINRPITGALVGRQPFGGFKMSGVGCKAGGPDYLQQFMEVRVVTENTLRRGFTPEDVD